MTTCSRPTCTRTASGPHGYCNPHAYATGAIQPRMPATLAQAIIRRHLDDGHTLQAIANATGLADSGLRKILAGDRGTVRASTIQALRDAMFDGVPVPAWRIARRLQALMAAGWEQRHIAAESGVTRETIRNITLGLYDSCYPKVAQPIFQFYAEHEADPVQPPSRLASQHGWLPPAAWDDIDDHDEMPAEFMGRHPVTPADRDALTAMHTRLGSWDLVAQQLGTTVGTLKGIARGSTMQVRGDVAARLHRRVAA